jgi:hypothetical protein
MELRHLRCFLAVAEEHSLTSGDERPLSLMQGARQVSDDTFEDKASHSRRRNA